MAFTWGQFNTKCSNLLSMYYIVGFILCMGAASEIRYKVASFYIGWSHTQIDSCFDICLAIKITAVSLRGQWVNTLRPRQNGRHFADDTFKRIFMNENVRISINISLKFVPKGLINNIPAMVQIMGWRRPGDKPLSEPMMVNLLTHTYMRHSASMS